VVADEDYEEGELAHDETEIDFMPKFREKGRHLVVDKGTTINLECVVDKLPGNERLITSNK